MVTRIDIVSVTTVEGSSSVLANWLAGLVSVIDFNSVVSGTAVDTVYEPWGVTFDAVRFDAAALPPRWIRSGHAFASNRYDAMMDSDPNDTTAGQDANVVTIAASGNAPFDDLTGGVRAVFKRPQLYVSIDVQPMAYTGEHTEPSPTTVPYLQVFGPEPAFPHHGPPTLLATIYFPLATTDPQFETWQRMEFVSASPTPNIGSVVFSSKTDGGVGAPVYALFDNLRFAHHLPLTGTDQIG